MQDNDISFWMNLVHDFFEPGALKRWCLSSYSTSPVGRHAQGLFPMVSCPPYVWLRRQSRSRLNWLLCFGHLDCRTLNCGSLSSVLIFDDGHFLQEFWFCNLCGVQPGRGFGMWPSVLILVSVSCSLTWAPTRLCVPHFYLLSDSITGSLYPLFVFHTCSGSS